MSDALAPSNRQRAAPGSARRPDASCGADLGGSRGTRVAGLPSGSGPLASQRVGAAIVHPPRTDRSRTGGGHILTFARVAVAHKALATLGGVGGHMVVGRPRELTILRCTLCFLLLRLAAWKEPGPRSRLRSQTRLAEHHPLRLARLAHGAADGEVEGSDPVRLGIGDARQSVLDAADRAIQLAVGG